MPGLPDLPCLHGVIIRDHALGPRSLRADDVEPALRSGRQFCEGIAVGGKRMLCPRGTQAERGLCLNFASNHRAKSHSAGRNRSEVVSPDVAIDEPVLQPVVRSGELTGTEFDRCGVRDPLAVPRCLATRLPAGWRF